VTGHQAVVRVLALVPSLYDTSPGQRFRMEQWARWLKPEGIAVTFEAFEDESLHRVLYQPGRFWRKAKLVARASWQRASFARKAADYHVVYLFREAAVWGPAVVERWLARSGVPLVFDFDDAIFVRYASPANGYLSYLKFPGKTRTLCRLARHVMAGNEYLARYARAFNGNVTVVPTTIDTTEYRVEARAAHETPVIGWSGSFSTAQHLDGLRSALQRLARERSFRLRVIGAPLDYAIPGVDLETLPWKASTEVEDLRGIDIGVMPLPDDPWSQGKCGLKALQYMALAIPAVCSPVGVNADIVRNGTNGLLAATDDEWVTALRELLDDRDLRERLGRAARATVERRYSAAVHAPAVRDILRAAAEGRTVSRSEGAGA